MTTMELDQLKSLLAESTTNPNSPARKQDVSISVVKSYNLSEVLEPEAKFEAQFRQANLILTPRLNLKLQDSTTSIGPDIPSGVLAQSTTFSQQEPSSKNSIEKSTQTDEYGVLLSKGIPNIIPVTDKKMVPMRLGAISKQIKENLVRNYQLEESTLKSDLVSGKISQRGNTHNEVPKLNLKPSKDVSLNEKPILLRVIPKVDKDGPTTPLKNFLLERQLRRNVKEMLGHSPEPTKISRQASNKNYKSQDGSVQFLAQKERIVFNSRENSVREVIASVLPKRESYEKPSFGSPQIKTNNNGEVVKTLVNSYRTNEGELRGSRVQKENLETSKDRKSIDFQVFIQNKMLLNKPTSVKPGVNNLSRAVERKNTSQPPSGCTQMRTSPIQADLPLNSPNKLSFVPNRRYSRQLAENSQTKKFEPPARMVKIWDSSSGFRDQSRASLE